MHPNHIAAAAAVLVMACAPLRAQTDTLGPVEVFNDVFPGTRGYVVLSEGVVYRIEVVPAATITIRSARRPRTPPLFLTPLDEQTDPQQGRSFLIVPRESEEFRIDVAASDPVRVRIIRDLRESARWARLRQATRDLPAAGVSLRAAYLGAFSMPQISATDPDSRDGLGYEICVAAVPRGAWLDGPVGGCALTLARYDRGPEATVALGIAPHVVLSHPDRSVEIGVGISGWIGTQTGRREETYWMLGFDLLASTPVAGRLLLEAQGGVRYIAVDSPGGSTATANTVPHLAVGLQIRL